MQNGLIYTQEQRGEEELVTAYKAANGALVWRHADPVRFFESNAGAGPRATLGATGILNALDAATGQRIWARSTTGEPNAACPSGAFLRPP